MRLSTLAKIVIGGAVGFAGAGTLRRGDEPPQQLPQPVRDQMQRAGEGLRSARASATGVLVEVERARAAAEQESMQADLQRQGREPSADGDSSE